MRKIAAARDNILPFDAASAGAGLFCKKFLVVGRVQGVFYRATIAQHARSLAVTGHAHNLPDGRVEVLACGHEDALAELERCLWIGSSASKVTRVEVQDLDFDPRDRPQSFVTR